MQYLGGSVETNPVIYLVFWGFSGPNDTTADPDGLAAYLSDFAAALPSSLWLNTLTQYYQTVGITTTYITNPVGQLGGIWYDTALPPATYQQSDVANEALDAVAHFGYHADANFIIVTPHGHATTGFPSQFCGYHAATTVMVSGTALPVPYTNLPYMPDAGADCGAGSVNMPGTLDGASIVGGHEAAETQSDPVVNTGWIDVNDQEVADKCAWTDLGETMFPDGSSFPTQPLFSNASGSCVQSYGTPTPTPTPNATATPTAEPTPTPTAKPTPTAPANVIANGGFETGKLAPWVTCPSGAVPSAIVTARHPQSGNHDAFAGALAGKPEPNGTTSVCQLIRVPTHGKLTLWTFGVSTDKSSKAKQFGRLYAYSGALVATLYTVNRDDRAWRHRTFDLSAYADKRLYVAFGVIGDGGDPGKSMGQYIDTVSLTAAP